MVQPLWKLWLRSRLKAALRGSDPAAEEMLNDTLEKGTSHLERQRRLAIKDAVLDRDHGDRMTELLADEDRILEHAFMWGWYHEYAKTAGEFPTAPSMRASLHMMHHLMKRSGLSPKDARAEAAALDRMWNEADPLCDAMINCAAKSFHDPSKAWLTDVLQGVSASGRRGGTDP